MDKMQEEQLVLRTEGLVKMYGKRTVVNDVSFNVKPEWTHIMNVGNC